MRRTVEFAAAVAIAATLATGCTPPSLPTSPAEQGAGFFASPPAEGFDVLRRNVSLARALTAKGTIGAEGGTLRIAEAGVALVVPPGALAEPVEITLEALAGNAVAFEFAPHGLTFARPASIQIRAEGTEAESLLGGAADAGTHPRRLDRFLGVYFQGDPTVGVEPLENLETYLLDGSVVFEIDHFSGYACASG